MTDSLDKTLLSSILHTTVENLMWICRLLATLHCWIRAGCVC